jgi:SAM-dependent MidA family methyltransferase
MTDSVQTGFSEEFRVRADAKGRVPFDRFMELALYHPSLGYYQKDRQRVGTAEGSDFVTATSTGTLFGELICAAAVNLLRARGANPADFEFVEIGAETDLGVLAGVAHPFATARTLRLGDSLKLSGRLVVFSNELLDAQPCRRFLRRRGGWSELGVQLGNDGRLLECDLGRAHEPWLPEDAPEGYRFDAPRAAVTLVEMLASQDWGGLFLAFDYGKSFDSLSAECPVGTVRAYYRHTQVKELLERPGEQDLTCHVCWDWLRGALEDAGFVGSAVDSQESFFVHQASHYIAAQVTADAGRPTQRKMALMQLIHPANMGQKFQALRAWRA